MAETTIEGITLSQLPKVTALAANDLIEIDRNGTGAAVSSQIWSKRWPTRSDLSA